jgi:hypothetical protein
MKNFFLILTFISQITYANTTKIEGTFSAQKEVMKCQGYWEHPFLPIERNYGGRIPSTPLLSNENSIISIESLKSGIKILKKDSDNEEVFISSYFSALKGINISVKDNSIILKQYDSLEVIFDYGTFIGIISNMRFKAILRLDSNNDLVIENYYAKNNEILTKKIECTLPRIY